MVDEDQERDVQDTRRRRAQAMAAAAVAALLLVGIAGCGGSSSDGGSDGAAATTQADGGDSGGDGGDQGEASGELPNPCDLVPIETASEILGGEAAAPEAESSDVGVASASCTWQTQDGKDNPTLDGAGHILTLQAIDAPETMDMNEFWSASKGAGDEDADVEGCDEAFWMGGLLSALKDGVYLTGSAGLADDSPDAKASTEQLVSTACANV